MDRALGEWLGNRNSHCDWVRYTHTSLLRKKQRAYFVWAYIAFSRPCLSSTPFFKILYMRRDFASSLCSFANSSAIAFGLGAPALVWIFNSSSCDCFQLCSIWLSTPNYWATSKSGEPSIIIIPVASFLIPQCDVVVLYLDPLFKRTSCPLFSWLIN